MGPEDLDPALARSLVRSASLGIHLMPSCWLETRRDHKMMNVMCLSSFQVQKEKRGKEGEMYYVYAYVCVHAHSHEGEVYRA